MSGKGGRARGTSGEGEGWEKEGRVNAGVKGWDERRG
jgi:hypothetical protein